MAEELPFYDATQVGTKNVGRPPNWITYTEFAFECLDSDGHVVDSFTNTVQSKAFIDAKDWTRQEVTDWLASQGIHPTSDTSTPIDEL